MILRKPKNYVPTDEDKQWLFATMNSLKVGGKLVTDLVIYEKVAEDVIKVGVYNPVLSEMGFGLYEVNMEIIRMKMVAHAIGFDFIDSRENVWN